MVKELEGKSGGVYLGNIVKTKDGRVLVVKDEIENEVYLVLGIHDKENSKTANILLDKNYNLQTFGPCKIIEENNTAYVDTKAQEDCGGELLDMDYNVQKFRIVYCKLEKEDDFVEDSGCCDCLCNWCKNLCP